MQLDKKTFTVNLSDPEIEIVNDYLLNIEFEEDAKINGRTIFMAFVNESIRKHKPRKEDLNKIQDFENQILELKKANENLLILKTGSEQKANENLLILKTRSEQLLTEKLIIIEENKTLVSELENLQLQNNNYKAVIENQQKEIGEQKAQIIETSKNLSSDVEILQQTIKGKQAEIERQFVVIENLKDEVASKHDLNENQVIVTLAKPHQILIESVLMNERTINSFDKLAKGEKTKKAFLSVTTTSKQKNIENLLLNVLIGSSMSMKLVTPFTEKEIIVMFNS